MPVTPKSPKDQTNKPKIKKTKTRKKSSKPKKTTPAVLTAEQTELVKQRPAHWFKPGQSGNPGGRTFEFAECQRMAREASPKAMARLIELIDSTDERVATLASDKILERAWGKPKEQKDDDPLSRLSPEERRARLVELLAFAATLKVPGEPQVIEHQPTDGAPAIDSAE